VRGIPLLEGVAELELHLCELDVTEHQAELERDGAGEQQPAAAPVARHPVDARQAPQTA